MTTTRRLVTGLATAALVMSALSAGTATAATKGRIVINNNCGKAASTTIHRTNGDMIAGTAAAPAGTSFGYPVYPGTYVVRVPAGSKTVKVLDVSPKAHTVIVKAC
ncbi:hypothetical protein [Lentzea sp. CA-135723]|uniref:hypothetical protein n=1 Tax=Lentzea sp. CA-135723 TaxID=3239950 RepID=UPI003D8F1230